MAIEQFVQQATPLDAGLMAAIHASCFPRPWDEATMAHFISGPGCLCLIASALGDRAAEAAGLLIARKAADEAEILTFGVAPSCRRMGLGRALLQRAIAVLAAGGAKRLYLEVEDGNEAALTLYRALGAVPVGRRPGYYERGADASIFSLAL
jgi:[ribosomal protein S18]-alanine N-acetyltransferase